MSTHFTFSFCNARDLIIPVKCQLVQPVRLCDGTTIRHYRSALKRNSRVLWNWRRHQYCHQWIERKVAARTATEIQTSHWPRRRNCRIRSTMPAEYETRQANTI